jgi:decaprenyl-phosphate phosphoribosyltransferase
MAGRRLPALVRAARPHQWTKNLLVFAAPVAGGVVTEAEPALRSVGAFVAFSMAAGGTYLLNDALDVEADRLHPTKRHRPVASGEVSPVTAQVVGALLLVAALALGFAIAVPLGITVLGYLGLTTAYSFALKRIAVVDLIAVASGFVLRAVAGAAATDIPISQWFFIVTSAGALLMITGKREAELAHLGAGGSTRKVLEEYTAGFLASVRSIAAGVALIAYCLWAFDPPAGVGDTAEIFFLASIAPFAVAILRYALLIDRGEGAEPERLVLSDRTLGVAGAAWAMIYAYGAYLA